MSPLPRPPVPDPPAASEIFLTAESRAARQERRDSDRRIAALVLDLQARGYCGVISDDRYEVCSLDASHSEAHGWLPGLPKRDDWSTSP